MRKNNGERQRDGDGFRLRAAGVCTRGEGVRREILLVSGGKDDGHWVIPGGGIEKDEDASTAALREVLEEAGVRAQILSSVGEFRDEERRHRTMVFLLSAVEELKEWDDSCIGRRRAWLSLDESLQRVKQSQVRIIQQIIKMRD